MVEQDYPAAAIVRRVTIVVGTSSWSDPGFVEHWYPKGLPAKERLAFYAERFDAVELNSSFYAIPAISTVEGWAKGPATTSASTSSSTGFSPATPLSSRSSPRTSGTKSRPMSADGCS